MLALVRALTYAALFIGFFLVFVPQRILHATGIVRPPWIGPAQMAGLELVALGGGLAVWCVMTFALVGKGTPAPFDPPRKLVIAGPYRWVRNPMYLSALLLLVGESMLLEAPVLLGYAAAFFLVTHLFVVLYEEPALRRKFGDSYDRFRATVPRWLPRRPR